MTNHCKNQDMQAGTLLLLVKFSQAWLAFSLQHNNISKIFLVLPPSNPSFPPL